MALAKTKPLQKNPFIKEVKKNSSVKGYTTFAKLKKNSPKFISTLENQKILANDVILSERVKHKVRGLSSAEQRLANKLFSEMYLKIILRSSQNPVYTKRALLFLKEFSKAIDRKEGQIVIEVLKKASTKVNDI